MKPRQQLVDRLAPEEQAWLDDAITAIAADPAAIRGRFPAVGRRVGRDPLDPDARVGDLHAWTVDDAGRLLLLQALGPTIGDELADLYRYGDANERRGVLRALPWLDIGDSAIGLVEDALRTNDLRLIAAALGPYAAEHLDDHAFAHAVLKAVFVGVPLHGVAGLDRRVSPELSRMMAGYVHERVAAGRDVPDEVWPIIDRYPPHEQLSAIEAEAQHPIESRRSAARRALAGRSAGAGLEQT